MLCVFFCDYIKRRFTFFKPHYIIDKFIGDFFVSVIGRFKAFTHLLFMTSTITQQLILHILLIISKICDIIGTEGTVKILNTCCEEKNMLLNDINPFIRYAAPVVLTESTKTTYSYDSRLIYVNNGSCQVNLNGENYDLHNGSMTIWKAGTPYRLSVENKIYMVVINFDFTQSHSSIESCISPVLKEMFNEKKITESPCFSDFEILNLPIIIHNKSDSVSKIESIINEFSSQRLGYLAMSSSLLKELIITCVRIAQMNIPENFSTINKIISYIEKNYTRNISNEELANISGYHPYHLNRLMKNSTGITMHSYLTYIRIEKSKEFLLNTDYSISQISEMCGFACPYYFSSAFKKATSVTPSFFRKTKKNIL